MAISIERDRGRPKAKNATTHNARQPVLPHYVIARHKANGLELMHVPLESGEETLPVFSSEAAARNFLLSSTPRKEWYARESYAGELASLLLGLYASTEWVLIDPLPGERTAEDHPSNIVHWKGFVDHLLGSRYCLFPTPPQNLVLAAAPETGNLSLGREDVSS